MLGVADGVGRRPRGLGGWARAALGALDALVVGRRLARLRGLVARATSTGPVGSGRSRAAVADALVDVAMAELEASSRRRALVEDAARLASRYWEGHPGVAARREAAARATREVVEVLRLRRRLEEAGWRGLGVDPSED